MQAVGERRGETRRDALILLAIAMAVRLLYFLQYRRSPFYDFLHLDPLYYHEWAARIAAGDWLGGEVFEQSPLYPYLLALYLTVFGKGLTLLRLIQFAIGSATVVLTYSLGRRIFGRASAVVAALATAVYGPFLFYEGQVMKEFLTPFFSAAMLLLFHAALEARAGSAGSRIGRAPVLFALSGLCIGLAALVRDNFLLLLPLLAGYAAVAPWRHAPRPAEKGDEAGRRGSKGPRPDPAGAAGSARTSAEGSLPRRVRFSGAAAMIAGALAVLLPVAARNRAVAGEWVLTTSGGGEVFYIGNGPYANGAYVPPPWVRSNPRFEHEDFRSKARDLTGRPLSRSEASRFWYGEGLKAIASDPWRWTKVMARKALLFLDDHELPDNYSFYSFRRFSWLLAILPTFGWIAALAAPGIVVTAPRWRELLPLYLAAAGYMASVMIFFNFARFRLPFVQILTLFAGAGAVAVAGALTSAFRAGRGYARGAALAALILVIFAATHVDLSSGSEEPFQDRLHLGAAYRQAGRLDEAEEVLKATIRDAEAVLERHGWKPGAPSVPGGITFALALHAAHRDLAGILMDSKRIDEAIAEMEAAVPLDPNDADLFQRLSGAYRTRGDLPSAERACRRGLAIQPSSFPLRFDLATVLYESGRPGEALAELLRAKEMTPGLAGLDLADWHYGMGTVLHALPGREEESIAHFRQGLGLNPDHPQAAEVRKLIASRG
jgi:tetratricopeptide (TPR) repeat protein